MWQGCAIDRWHMAELIDAKLKSINRAFPFIFQDTLRTGDEKDGNGEIPHFADGGYGYVLTFWKVCTCSQSSARPDFSEYGYGYV